MINTVILFLIFLILGQFSGSLRVPRSVFECSHYLGVSISPLLRSLIFSLQTFRSLLHTLGGVRSVRPGPGTLPGSPSPPQGPHPVRPSYSLPRAARPARRPRLGPERPHAGARTGTSSVLGSFSFRRQPRDCSLPLPPLSFPTLRRSLTPPGLLTLDRLWDFIRPSGASRGAGPLSQWRGGSPFKLF